MTSLTAVQAEAMRARLNVTAEAFAAAAADAGVVLLPAAFDDATRARVMALALALRDAEGAAWEAKREELQALLVAEEPGAVYKRWRLPSGATTGRFATAHTAWIGVARLTKGGGQ